MKTNTQDSLARIKEEGLESGKGYARQDCRLKPKIRGRNVKRGPSFCRYVYLLPSSSIKKKSVDICFIQGQVSKLSKLPL